MEQRIINMLELGASKGMKVSSSLSFQPFLKYLYDNRTEAFSAKTALFNYIIGKLEAARRDTDEVSLENLADYTEIFDLLFLVLTNVTEDEEKMYWGISLPMTPTMIYGTRLFYKILEEANIYDQECALCDEDYEGFLKSELQHYYNFILKRFYGFRLFKTKAFVRTVRDPESGLTRHFSISLNTNFVEAAPQRKLPVLDEAAIKDLIHSKDGLMQLTKILPIDLFSFSGFTVTTVTDISKQYAMELIRNIIVNNANNRSQGFPEVEQALKELTGKTNLNFNILPLLQLNGKLVEDPAISKNSLLFSRNETQPFDIADSFVLLEELMASAVNYHLIEPETETSENLLWLSVLRAAKLHAYVLFPVIYNGKLVGAIEMYSKADGIIDDKIIAILEEVMGLLAQLLNNHVSAIEVEMEAIIKDRFTRLQPSVQWKFAEVAWKYLQQKRAGVKAATQRLEEIVFDHVYPLYGAVDIRNSTIERNEAMLKDGIVQLQILSSTLEQLKKKTAFGLLDEKIYLTQNWQQVLSSKEEVFNQQVKLNDFLDQDIMPFLTDFTAGNPNLQALTKPYFDAVDEHTGAAFAFRRNLENSMTQVISAVNNYLEYLKDEIQTGYPCYFEKFRTDGVEYDIYIGQSISPTKPFNVIYLKNLRLLQLTSMAAIARFTHALLPDLPHPVETTQLIFVHSLPIDILFRNDEKRFDVEGAYNIRYHIVKKRIDKVHLKNSTERLTQPGKIALVYFNDAEANEYLSHIRFLQADNMLNDDLEHLELELISGVTGLKALRVGVNLQETTRL